MQSSLAAARADNFYYPPEWTPNQVCVQLQRRLFKLVDEMLHIGFSPHLLFQGSLNKFHGQHALRERARKIDQGILIIRYWLAIMLFSIWLYFQKRPFVVEWNIIHVVIYFSGSICAIMGSVKVRECSMLRSWNIVFTSSNWTSENKYCLFLLLKAFLGLSLSKKNNRPLTDWNLFGAWF